MCKPQPRGSRPASRVELRSAAPLRPWCQARAWPAGRWRVSRGQARQSPAALLRDPGHARRRRHTGSRGRERPAGSTRLRSGQLDAAVLPWRLLLFRSPPPRLGGHLGAVHVAARWRAVARREALRRSGSAWLPGGQLSVADGGARPSATFAGPAAPLLTPSSRSAVAASSLPARSPSPRSRPCRSPAQI